MALAVAEEPVTTPTQVRVVLELLARVTLAVAVGNALAAAVVARVLLVRLI